MTAERVDSRSTTKTTTLSLEDLAPGVNNLRAGISREEAERFAHFLEDTGKFGLKVFSPKKGERNVLSWNILGKKAGRLRTGKYQSVMLITDAVRSFKTFQMSTYLQGQAELGEYLLAIPAADNPDREVKLYLYNRAA